MRNLVASYPRHRSLPPYEVKHDTLVHQPYGVYRVYAGNLEIGRQLSFPSAADCDVMASQKPRPAHELLGYLPVNFGAPIPGTRGEEYGREGKRLPPSKLGRPKQTPDLVDELE